MDGKAKEQKEIRGQNTQYVICQVCRRETDSEICTWEEDDGGMVCPDCRAERDSCGCSD